MRKPIPFTKKQIESISSDYSTPFHIYDEEAIRENAKKLIKAFSWNTGFKEFFAVKATPNPFILKLLKEEGFGADCSSMAELILAEKAGIIGEAVMFTSNNTPIEEIREAEELGAIINLDDVTHISMLRKVPEIISFRYNPGHLFREKSNEIIGKPQEAKYGLTREQLFEAYAMMKKKGVKRFGLHTMVASNLLDNSFFVKTAEMLFDLVVELNEKMEIKFEFVNLGGGMGIPYRPEEKAVDVELVAAGVREAYEKKIVAAGLAPVKIFLESGRLITGPYGYLVTSVRHVMKKHKEYVGVDASMADLMRPGMYGAYHHITVLGKEKSNKNHIYDVVGSLCENNDKFAVDRKLPAIVVGDTLVIHDTGAHGQAMGFNYNGMLRHTELLLNADGSVKLIRRTETLEDYFKTLDFSSFDR